MTTYAHHFEGIASEREPFSRIFVLIVDTLGWSWEESKPLFDRLWDHLTQDKYILTIYWENDGDIVSSPLAEVIVRDRMLLLNRNVSGHVG